MQSIWNSEKKVVNFDALTENIKTESAVENTADDNTENNTDNNETI
jgi:hypothetical protein